MSNLALSRKNTLERVLADLGGQADIISGILPPDLPLERFRANITNALHSNPRILDCEPRSIVQACMKAAYDGLRVDGREAAIVDHEMTINRGKQGEKKIKVAQYFPMSFGLIQQVLKGKEVAAMYAEVIREGDEYHVQRGTNAGIHHIPDIAGGGKILAAYSVATLANGAQTFEFLTGADLKDIRSAAQTQKVWDRWEGEMSKKSAVRRHRKTLPLGERDIVIRDAEADDLYPDMKSTAAALPGHETRPMPTRHAIADQQGTGSGASVDLSDDDREHVVIDQAAKDEPKGRKAKTKEEAGPAATDLPGDAGEWRQWASALDAEIMAAATPDDVNAIAAREEARLSAAPKDLANYLRGLITDRLADFATEGSPS